MDESSTTNRPTVLLAARVTPEERDEIRAAIEAYRRRTGRRLTLSDVVREGSLAHVRALITVDSSQADNSFQQAA
jgi:predicted nucleic-acid-binding protein